MRKVASRTHPSEISDEIVAYDPATLERRPVRKQEVVSKLLAQHNPHAARIVERMPAQDGILDPWAIDQLLVRVHCEMQRLSEEFQHGRRVAELLRSLLGVLRNAGVPRPIRVVDVGCGTGYVPRWLAANGALGDDVELVGADYNVALINEANRLAQTEQLKVKFVVANAFRLKELGAVYLSTGVMHHFRGDALIEFLHAHEQSGICAFLHFDFQPSPVAPLGSWLFHAVRYREPLAKHDGVLSAVRAHTGQTLVKAAEEGAPGFLSTMYSTCLWFLPIPRAFHTLIGIRPAYKEAFVRALGPRAGRLGSWQ